MHFPPASGNGDNNDGVSISYLDDRLDENDVEANHMEGLDHQEFDEAPPVEFVCDSFALTSSPGTGEEFVLLNPFSGCVEVYGSILDNAISSDESLLEKAMLDASENILRKRGSTTRSAYNEEDGFIPDENSEVITGEAIHNRFQLNHRMYDTPPKQVLFSTDDYFDLDVNEYFDQSGRGESDSVTVDWVGVDTHTALRKDCKSIAGTIIGAARILTLSSDQGEEELACTEVFAWKKDDDDECASNQKYSSKLVCRAAGSFYFLDICANHQKLYAAFQTGDCPFSEHQPVDERDSGVNRQLVDIDEESMVNEDGGPIRMSRAIYCLPLVRHSPSTCPETIASYFPEPDTCIVAQYPVSSFSIDPTGEILVVGTVHGTVEVWHTGLENNQMAPVRLQILSIREFFIKRHRSMTMEERRTTATTCCEVAETGLLVDDEHDAKAIDDVNFDDNATVSQDDLALLETSALEEDEELLPHKHPTSRVSQIYIPSHLPVQKCGFVTKQRSPESGTTLLLWQTSRMSSDDIGDCVSDRFRVTAMINLPLSAQCTPEVHYDGRRLIVFGKDHIGLIFLVYRVLGTRFDQREFDYDESKLSSKAEEESGGVVQMTSERRIKFVNRIRHAALGGLEYFDSLLQTANERFLAVNTKAGNLIGADGARSSEGLLVIDLKEYGC